MIDVSKLKLVLDSIDCEYRESCYLSEYTTFKIGGRCPIVILPNSAHQIAEIISFCSQNGVRYYIFGKGSNLLVNDDGLDAAVIVLRENFADIQIVSEDTILCSAGTSLAALCKFARDHSLTGLEFAYGIPGTVGGAVFMNAGAYGGEMSDVLVRCEAVTKAGDIVTMDKNQADFSYRHSVFENGEYCIISAEFKLRKGSKNEITARMNELMQKRKSKQPLEYPSAGSTFKRPEGYYAAALIEQCGLKGESVGGAQVSVKHSGFIINKDSATAKDVMGLIDVVKTKVFEKTGCKLECEVRLL